MWWALPTLQNEGEKSKLQNPSSKQILKTKSEIRNNIKITISKLTIKSCTLAVLDKLERTVRCIRSLREVLPTAVYSILLEKQKYFVHQIKLSISVC
jgi:hypothetical protein